MRFLAGLHTPAPKVLVLTAEFVINGALRRALEAPEFDIDQIRGILDTVTREKINLDTSGLEYVLRRRLNRMADELAEDPGNLALLARLHAIISMPLPFEINLWRVQNVFYSLLESEYPKRRHDPEWAARFTRLVEKLNIRVPAPQTEQPAPA
jgi:hypothetical protein